MAEWQVTLKIDEDLVRSYHEQTSEDPETRPSDVSDMVREFLYDAASGAGLLTNADARGGYKGYFSVSSASRVD